MTATTYELVDQVGEAYRQQLINEYWVQFTVTLPDGEQLFVSHASRADETMVFTVVNGETQFGDDIACVTGCDIALALQQAGYDPLPEGTVISLPTVRRGKDIY